MGLYGTVMEGIRGFDMGLMALFGAGCLVGLFGFSRLLSWLLRHHHTPTLQLLVGFIIGSLPVLWPWRELVRYQLGAEGQMIPLDYRYLTPADFAELTGEPAQLLAVIALMLAGAALVLLLAWANRSAEAARPVARRAAIAGPDKVLTRRKAPMHKVFLISGLALALAGCAAQQGASGPVQVRDLSAARAETRPAQYTVEAGIPSMASPGATTWTIATWRASTASARPTASSPARR